MSTQGIKASYKNIVTLMVGSDKKVCKSLSHNEY